MQPIKDYIASLFINKTIHVKCDCLLPIDITGIVVDYELIGTEIVICISKNGKNSKSGVKYTIITNRGTIIQRLTLMCKPFY